MRIITRKSVQRLKSIQGNKSRFFHTRFNIETLMTSPLICFPHFMDMIEFQKNLFLTRDEQEKQVMTLFQCTKFEA